MSLLFSGKSSVTPWIQQSVCDALLLQQQQQQKEGTAKQTKRPKLAQVIGRDPQSLRLSDGQAEIQAFLDPNRNNHPSTSLPAIGSAVRVNDWYVASVRMTQDHNNNNNKSDRICLVIRGGVDVLGGHGMPIHGKPENVHRLVDVRRALASLSIRPSELLPLYPPRRNGSHQHLPVGDVGSFVQQHNKKSSMQNESAAQQMNWNKNAQNHGDNLPIGSVAAFLEQQQQRHDKSSSSTKDTTTHRDLPVGNVGALLQNKQSMQLLTHTYHEPANKRDNSARDGFRGYNLMGNGVAFVTQDPTHIKDLIVSIRKEQAEKDVGEKEPKETNTATASAEDNRKGEAVRSVQSTPKQTQHSQKKELNAVEERRSQQKLAPVDDKEEGVHNEDESSESEEEEQGIEDMLLTSTPTKEAVSTEPKTVALLESTKKNLVVEEHDGTRPSESLEISKNKNENQDASDEEFALKYVHLLDRTQDNASPSEDGDDEDEYFETQLPNVFGAQPPLQEATKPLVDYVDRAGREEERKEDEGGDSDDDEMEQVAAAAAAPPRENTFQRWMRIAKESKKQVRPLEVGTLGGDTLRSLLIKKRRMS